MSETRTRYLPVTAAAALTATLALTVAVALAACSTPARTDPGPNAAPSGASSSAAAPVSPPLAGVTGGSHDAFCAAFFDGPDALVESADEPPTPAKATKVADSLHRLLAVAPPELAPDVRTAEDGFRRLASGTMDQRSASSTIAPPFVRVIQYAYTCKPRAGG